MGGKTMKSKKNMISIVALALGFASFSYGCGDDAGLYYEEKLFFEDANSLELDLSEEESSEFGIYGFYGSPLAPWPIFDYYNYPLPVLVPVNPVTNIIEWVHPMYIDQFLSGDFGPRDREPCCD
jgi:hypothetical protein